MQQVSHQTSRSAAFTLVEIMIVVGIVGLLSMIAIPSFLKARETVQITRFVKDVKYVADGVELYNFETGEYPDGAAAGVQPSGADDYIGKLDWAGGTTLGGTWDWDAGGAAPPPPFPPPPLELPDGTGDSGGGPVFQAALSVVNAGSKQTVFRQVDETLDDGQLWSGNFRQTGPSTYTYIVEQ